MDLNAHLLALENLANDVRKEISNQQEAARVAATPVAAPLTEVDTLESRLAKQEEEERAANNPPVEETTETPTQETTETATITNDTTTQPVVNSPDWWNMAARMGLVSQEYADSQIKLL